MISLNKICVLGLARSGLAVAKKIKELGGNPFLSEFSTEENFTNADDVRKNFTCEFGGHSDKVLENKLIIVSPGIPLNIPILRRARTKNIKIISEIEFGFLIKHKKSRIIAVTGSNGKSTTVSLIHHILQTGGYNSILAGNIGKAFTSYPIEKTGIDFIVLELSSFQLDSIDTFAPEVAVLLNITPDHLNRYDSFDDYANSKFRIFENQVKKEFAVLNKDDPQIKSRIAKIGSQKKYFSLRSKAEMYFDGENLTSSDITISKNLSLLKGPHNISNIMAALLSVSHLDIPNDLIVKAIRSFSSLEHRLEFVAEIENVVFINDSKATNTDAVKYALQSFSKPIRIILGGSNKGEDFSILLPFLKIYSKKLYLIGETQNKMRSFFNNEIELSCYNDFSDCIKSAFREAAKGEIVLLSPACASFDMFRNFEDRGRKFKKIVMEIKDEH